MTDTRTDRNKTHPTVKFSLSLVATAGDDEAIGLGTAGRSPGRARDFPVFLFLKQIVKYTANILLSMTVHCILCAM